MNYNITHNWLLEYIETDATPKNIQDYLSLSAVNVETLEQVGDDWVYDIEITSNRIDAASVLGFAMECVAVLPRHDAKATFKQNPLKDKSFKNLKTSSEKDISITIDEDEVSRLAAVILKNVTVGDSPDFIRERLEAVGERSINNVVDISNYLRIAYGQPVHTFDYDEIRKSEMIITKSNAGDRITLIDGKELELPGNDVIVKDGDGRIIDLVGLMGGENTGVTDKTENVLLFVPVVDKHLVRKTSMTTGHRSPAISYFEKGLDEERVEPTLVYGLELLAAHADAEIASDIFDHYPEPFTGSVVTAETGYINNLIAAKLSSQQIADMIHPLGFTAEEVKSDSITVKVPSYRSKDVKEPVDIAEEVARIYGYYNIASHIQQTDVIYQPIERHNIVSLQEDIRNFLPPLGFFEQYNYSMISKDLIKTVQDDPTTHLRISNTISKDIEYMRTSLVPSLLANVQFNEGFADTMNFFELARTYNKQDGTLPEEDEWLGMVSTEGYFKLKGYIEAMFEYLSVSSVSFVPKYETTFGTDTSCSIEIEGETIGYITTIAKKVRHDLNLPEDTSAAELSIEGVVQGVSKHTPYTEPNQFAHIKHDLTYTAHPEKPYSDLAEKAHEKSALLTDITVKDVYEDKVTIQCTFASKKKNITDKEAQKELEIVKRIFTT